MHKRLIISLPENTNLDSAEARVLIELARKAALYQQNRDDGGKDVLLSRKQGPIEFLAHAKNTKTGYAVHVWSQENPSSGAIA